MLIFYHTYGGYELIDYHPYIANLSSSQINLLKLVANEYLLMRLNAYFHGNFLTLSHWGFFQLQKILVFGFLGTYR